MISCEEFQSLIRRCPFSSPKKQVNHYFVDTDNQLRGNHITVRLREYPDKNMLEIKYSKQGEAAEGIPHLAVREEYAREVRGVHDVTADEVTNVTGVNIQNLHCVGSMTTFRSKYHLENDVSVCLDRNDYLGEQDYELEIEIPPDADINIAALLTKLGIRPSLPYHGGKCTRFLQLLRRGHDFE